MRTTLSYVSRLTCFLLLVGTVGEAARSGDDPPRVGLRSITRGRAAGLAPITSGRAAGLRPVTGRRPAARVPVTRGRPAGLRGVSTGRAARLPRVTASRPARLAPVTRDRVANLNPVSSGRPAGLEPVTRGRSAELVPVTRDRAAGLVPVSTGRAARPAPIDRVRGARRAPVTRGRAATLLPRNGVREPDLLSTLAGSGLPPVLSFSDGYVAPLRARSLIRTGSIRSALARPEEDAASAVRECRESRVGPVLRSPGLGANFLLRSGFQREPGKQAGSGPLAYYVRSNERGRGSARLLLLVPADHAEEVPETLDETLRGCPDPLEIGTKALSEGRYVHAALAFQEARYRRSDSVEAIFGLADAELALGNLVAAAGSIRAGLDLLSHWSEDLGLTRVAKGKGEILKRIEAVVRHSERNAASETGLFLLGYLQVISGIPEQVGAAGKTLRSALDHDPDGRHTLRLIRFLQTR